MARVYKPVGPDTNKAMAPVTETKAPIPPVKEPKRNNSEKKESGDS